MLCINLCEIDPRLLLTGSAFYTLFASVEKKYDSKIERVSIGSSFCSRFFLGSDMDELLARIDSLGLPVTLTIPIFSQKELAEGKERVLELCRRWGKLIDEATCNDLGMLNILKQNGSQKLNMGQLFFKDSRDCRYEASFHGRASVSRTTLPFAEYISGIELSPITSKIVLPEDLDERLMVALHGPYCFITTGHICKLASVPYGVERKFRPNCECKLQCSGIYEKTFYSEDAENCLIQFGRTVYSRQDQCALENRSVFRLLYWPIDELNHLRGLE